MPGVFLALGNVNEPRLNFTIRPESSWRSVVGGTFSNLRFSISLSRTLGGSVRKARVRAILGAPLPAR